MNRTGGPDRVAAGELGMLPLAPEQAAACMQATRTTPVRYTRSPLVGIE